MSDTVYSSTVKIGGFDTAAEAQAEAERLAALDLARRGIQVMSVRLDYVKIRSGGWKAKATAYGGKT